MGLGKDVLIDNLTNNLPCYGYLMNDLKIFDGPCSNHIKIRCGFVSAGSSDYTTGLHPLME